MHHLVSEINRDMALLAATSDYPPYQIRLIQLAPDEWLVRWLDTETGETFNGKQGNRRETTMHLHLFNVHIQMVKLELLIQRDKFAHANWN